MLELQPLMLSVLPLPAPLTLPFQETAEGVLGSPLICSSPLPSPRRLRKRDSARPRAPQDPPEDLDDDMEGGAFTMDDVQTDTAADKASRPPPPLPSRPPWARMWPTPAA